MKQTTGLQLPLRTYNYNFISQNIMNVIMYVRYTLNVLMCYFLSKRSQKNSILKIK